MDPGQDGVLQAGGADRAPQGRVAIVLGDAMRFISSNGLGDVSTALWSVILSNPEKSGLAAIHSVAKEAILKGESR